MAARSAGQHDWAFPRRFYRRGGSAILLLKLCWGARARDCELLNFRFNDPLVKAFGVQRFNESLARQSLADGGTRRQPALHKLRIKREAKTA